MDADTAAAEPGVEIAQPAAELIAAEPVAAEPAPEMPTAADSVVVESAPAEEAAAPTAEQAVVEITEDSTPMAAPDVPAGSSLDPAVSESTVSEPAGENAADNTGSGENTPEDPNETNVEPQYEAGPFIYDTDEYMVTVSFGANAQIPAGTTLTWREFIAGPLNTTSIIRS